MQIRRCSADLEDLYEILEVPHDASQADIKKAYRRLVHQYHPDSHPGDKDIEEKFKKINAAYSVLNDPDKRAYYDRTGSTRSGSDPFGGMGGVTFEDLIENINSMFGGFGSFSRRNPSSPRRGDDIETIVRLTLREAYHGVTREIEIQKWETCQHCQGSGAKPGTHPETCPTCKGSGQLRQVQRTLLGQFMTSGPCPECHGTGKIIREKCDECHGEGRVRRKHKIERKIPAGVERNMHMVIEGAGEAGYNGGPAGDLYLVFDVEPDKDFERDGADLHTTLVLTYPQAVLGTEAKIHNIDDTEGIIPVPPGTPHGQVLKVKGKGMPKLNSPLNAYGDLYAHVYIDIPKDLTDKQRELIKALADEMKAPVGVNEPGFFDKVRNFFK